MTQQNSIIVKGKYNGFRLDQFLAEVYFPWQEKKPNRKAIQALIQTGRIRVNGQSVRPSYRVKPGENISIREVKTIDGPKEEKAELPLVPILFENDDFLVITKPAGLSMHPSKASQKGTLVDWIRSRYPSIVGVGESPLRPGIVHRLDKETSGITVLAKNNASFKGLKAIFRERKVDKTYTALVYGKIREKKGSIDTPIGRIEKSALRGIPLKKRLFAGSLRPSLTEYELSTSYPQYSLLSIKPKTGRTHQIRVHMASIGHPIVGDLLYRFKTHRKDSIQPPHQLLHAARLTFSLFGQSYTFEGALPQYFSEVLKHLDEK